MSAGHFWTPAAPQSGSAWLSRRLELSGQCVLLPRTVVESPTAVDILWCDAGILGGWEEVAGSTDRPWGPGAGSVGATQRLYLSLPPRTSIGQPCPSHSPALGPLTAFPSPFFPALPLLRRLHTGNRCAAPSLGALIECDVKSRWQVCCRGEKGTHARHFLCAVLES